MRCRYCFKRIRCPYAFGIWRDDEGRRICYRSPTAYHAP
jgi:hypothetical protein